MSPLVLLVEDRQEALEQKRELFAEVGCAVIGVASSDDAIRQLWSSPLVGAVYTDIDLDPEEAFDVSGIQLMQYLKKVRPDLPVIGYSGRFGSGELEDAVVGQFDAWYPRGTLTAEGLEDSIRDVKRRAEAYSADRAKRAYEKLRSLQEAHNIDVTVFDNYLAMLPNSQYEVEQVLVDSGYEALIVHGLGGEADDSGHPLAGSGATAHFKVPMVLWVCERDGAHEAEVLGFPQLYAEGSSQEEAVASLVELVALFAFDLAGGGAVGGVAQELQEFLGRVLEVR